MFVYAFGEWYSVISLHTEGFFIMYKGEKVFIFERDIEAYCQE